MELSTPVTFLLEGIDIFTGNKDFSKERQQEIELHWEKVREYSGHSTPLTLLLEDFELYAPK